MQCLVAITEVSRLDIINDYIFNQVSIKVYLKLTEEYHASYLRRQLLISPNTKDYFIYFF